MYINGLRNMEIILLYLLSVGGQVSGKYLRDLNNIMLIVKAIIFLSLRQF